MMNIGFIAVESFVPTPKYIEWSRLFQLRELVSFDCALCPRIIKEHEYTEDDYKHIGWFESISYFKDLKWLINRVGEIEDKQILAITMEPVFECKNLVIDDRFKFYGYDLIEESTCISALTNCGGFDDVFLPNELTEYGLIHEINRAKEIQAKLSDRYPDEPHAQCELWAIWRMETI